MKRTPLIRKTPMKRNGSALKRTAIKRSSKQLPFRSEKMKAIYEERRPLVERLLRERPVCQTKPEDKSFLGCTFKSTQVHEILTRARGGSILDEDNCLAICGPCHAYITDWTTWAEAHGYVNKAPPKQ